MKVKNTKYFKEFNDEIGICIFNKVPQNRFLKKKEELNIKSNQKFVLRKEISQKSTGPKKNDKLINKETRIYNLKKKISILECGLKETATQLVFSEGNINSKIMIIGDTPGSDEDRTGKPFSGKSGILLENILSSINLSKINDCYLSNLIFWRPPGNRPPNKDEINICLPLTKEHISIIKPELLVLLGGITGKAILNIKDSVTKNRGKDLFYHYDNKQIPCKILFHPGFLLDNPIEKKNTWSDLKEIHNMLKKYIK